MADEKSIDDLLRELGYGDVADIAPAKPAPKKETAKKKVKDLLLEGAKQGRAGLGHGTRKQLKLLDKRRY